MLLIMFHLAFVPQGRNHAHKTGVGLGAHQIQGENHKNKPQNPKNKALIVDLLHAVHRIHCSAGGNLLNASADFLFI